MRNIELSHSSEIDESDAKNTSGETTWDDIASLKDQIGELQPRIDGHAGAKENIDKLRLSDRELIELTAKWKDVKINQETLQAATERNGNPNMHGKGLFFKSGNLPMDDDSVYRHVGTSAISDLMAQGFVRNGREAAGALDKPGGGFGTIGPGVYWNNGNSQKRETADLVIQASKAAAERGYVTKDDIQGIWVTDKNTGQPVNLIDGQDHTELEIADHRR